jgi:hypothetical protein
MATVTQPCTIRHPEQSAAPTAAPSSETASALETPPHDQAQSGEIIALEIGIVGYLFLWLLSLVPFLTGVWN